MLFAAIGVVVQLKDALNVVWEVEESKESGLWHFARNYVLSFAAVLALGFLLLVSLLVTAGLAAAGKFIAPYMPEGILHLVSMLVSFAVVAVLFAMMFKWLPDVSVAWGDVWLGALLTALFFEFGKAAIGFYIGKQGLESTYGAAASIVVVLIWVYYTSQIILMGAEITHAYSKRHHHQSAEVHSCFQRQHAGVPEIGTTSREAHCLLGCDSKGRTKRWQTSKIQTRTSKISKATKAAVSKARTPAKSRANRTRIRDKVSRVKTPARSQVNTSREPGQGQQTRRPEAAEHSQRARALQPGFR